MSNHKKYMRRCFELAQNGFGQVAPNPMVGAVIVHKDKIIGEGYHATYGGDHAEVVAVNSVKDRSLLKESIMYISLEPCSHQGKTPPCTDLIESCGFREVVISCIDANPIVEGSGIKKLEDAGFDVISGVLEKEGRELNKRFFIYHQKKRPYITLKWAQTKDGYMDVVRNDQEPKDNWITNSMSGKMVHLLRSKEQAILVGTNTAENDNPRLTVRKVKGRNPLRVLIDKDLRLPPGLHLFDRTVPTLVFTEQKAEDKENLCFSRVDFSAGLVEQMLKELYRRDIQSLIVEGGRYTLEKFIEKNLWDEAHVFVGDKWFGKGLEAPSIPTMPGSEIQLEEDRMVIFRNYPAR